MQRNFFLKFDLFRFLTILLFLFINDYLPLHSSLELEVTPLVGTNINDDALLGDRVTKRESAHNKPDSKLQMTPSVSQQDINTMPIQHQALPCSMKKGSDPLSMFVSWMMNSMSKTFSPESWSKLELKLTNTNSCSRTDQPKACNASRHTLCLPAREAPPWCTVKGSDPRSTFVPWLMNSMSKTFSPESWSKLELKLTNTNSCSRTDQPKACNASRHTLCLPAREAPPWCTGKGSDPWSTFVPWLMNSVSKTFSPESWSKLELKLTNTNSCSRTDQPKACDA